MYLPPPLRSAFVPQRDNGPDAWKLQYIQRAAPAPSALAKVRGSKPSAYIRTAGYPAQHGTAQHGTAQHTQHSAVMATLNKLIESWKAPRREVQYLAAGTGTGEQRAAGEVAGLARGDGLLGCGKGPQCMAWPAYRYSATPHRPVPRNPGTCEPTPGRVANPPTLTLA
ncbi:hypothetical protein A9Z42_0070800 [Trichoderma parareesei]|uniref:Uncharacterized protein n=1 Tax=Trichoderma parareesei TaxID=858221 RepID=A0A2H2ZWI3_TRIPA|nr:hypothetical protein A9Z42_0070800 [Trichoderma parareesei]